MKAGKLNDRYYVSDFAEDPRYVIVVCTHVHTHTHTHTPPALQKHPVPLDLILTAVV